MRIYDYATASTDKSIVIIGGWIQGDNSERTSIINEYKDGKWAKIGNLLKSSGHSGLAAITSGSITMVVGGYPSSNVELWDFESLESNKKGVYLHRYEFPGLFLVDIGFCSKN